MSESCALCGASDTKTAIVRIVLGVSDLEWSKHLHERCLGTLLAAHLAPLTPERRGQMPAAASCGVCGGHLPIVGRHPYFLSIGDADAERTWFIHAHCLPEELQPSAPQA